MSCLVLCRPACVQSSRRWLAITPVKAFVRSFDRPKSDCQAMQSKVKLQDSIKKVAAQEITPQAGVQHILDLSKGKSYEQLENLSDATWSYAIDKASLSEASAIAVTDFLIHLSDQDSPSQYWRDMPGLCEDIRDFWCGKSRRDLPEHETCNGRQLTHNPSAMEMPSKGPERKPAIKTFLKQVHFTSLLIRSCRPFFDDYVKFVFWNFRDGLEWHRTDFEPKDLDIYIPAMAVQMETAGLRLKTICPRDVPALGYAKCRRRTVVKLDDRTWREDCEERFDRYTLGRWCDWQKRLSKLATDKRLDTDLRRMAKETSEKMAL